MRRPNSSTFSLIAYNNKRTNPYSCSLCSWFRISDSWESWKKRSDHSLKVQDRLGRINEYAFPASSRKVSVAEHKRLALKIVTKLLGAETKIVKCNQTTPWQNSTKSRAIRQSFGKEELDETNYWNLRREGLDGKSVQVWYDADVVVAYLNNNDESDVSTRRSGGLNN